MQHQRSIEQEISLLFEDAIGKLDKIDAQVKEEKKEIVRDLAKDLEGKIQTDTICIEIVKQLRGRVSERFVRECLDEKYKQKRCIENARKQKRREQEGNEKLAAVTPLNQEGKNKEVILDVDNQPKYTASKSNQNIHSILDNQKTSYETDCPRCKELEDALLSLASSLVPADKVQND